MYIAHTLLAWFCECLFPVVHLGLKRVTLKCLLQSQCKRVVDPLSSEPWCSPETDGVCDDSVKEFGDVNCHPLRSMIQRCRDIVVSLSGLVRKEMVGREDIVDALDR